MIRCHDPDLQAALAGVESGLVFVARANVANDWESIRGELADAFRLSQEAAQNQRSIVYVVSADDLLGRNGKGQAIVASGLLSAARSAALELVRGGTTVNVLAIDSGQDSSNVARWVDALLSPGAPQGELVRLGPGHLGKALP